ncbi:MAG: hypothetical protein R2759_03655 [Bacteroidales bacterium]
MQALEVNKPAFYCKIISGTSILPTVKNAVSDGDLRFISGGIYTGDHIEKHDYLGFYANQLLRSPKEIIRISAGR